jgi:hypothetical protein
MIPTRRLVWNKRAKAFQPEAPASEFLKGPVPISWLGRMLELNSATVCGVGLVLWFLCGARRSRTVKLATISFGGWTPSRFAKSRALQRLVDAHLISIEAGPPGRAPVVTLLVHDNGESDAPGCSEKDDGGPRAA